MLHLYTLTDVVRILAERGIATSASSVGRYISRGVVAAPDRAGGRPIWDDTALDELARRVAAHQHDLRENGWGVHRRGRAADDV